MEKSEIRPVLTDKEIEEIQSINSLIKPENWDKAMYDSFMLGYKLGVYKAKRGER